MFGWLLKNTIYTANYFSPVTTQSLLATSLIVFQSKSSSTFPVQFQRQLVHSEVICYNSRTVIISSQRSLQRIRRLMPPICKDSSVVDKMGSVYELTLGPFAKQGVCVLFIQLICTSGHKLLACPQLEKRGQFQQRHLAWQQVSRRLQSPWGWSVRASGNPSTVQTAHRVSLSPIEISSVICC